MTSRQLAVVSLGLLSATARADDDPAFATLDRQDATSRAGLEGSYFKLKGDATGTLLRFDGYGQYVDPGTGLGGYAQLPISAVFASGDSGHGIGGLELGGIYTVRTSDEVRLVLHAGLALPTASSDETGGITNLATALGARPVDFVLAFPDATTARAGGAILFHSGQMFGRLELGVDVNLKAKQQNVPTYAHFDAAVGVDTGVVAFTLESTNAYFTSSDQGSSLAKQTVDALALSVRGRTGPVEPYLAVIVGLDDDARIVSDFAITAGVAMPLR